MKNNLKVELHEDKIFIAPLVRGIDFVGFRNFYDCRLLRKRNIQKMRKIIVDYEDKEISFLEIFDIFKGWRAYAKWSDCNELEEEFKGKIIEELWKKI
ncbi:MAG: hypothetical protein KKD18_01170 [Nanoarchaeota archaeon]|nr:hypothetical protein [Nanoarchaeota archaeon]